MSAPTDSGDEFTNKYINDVFTAPRTGLRICRACEDAIYHYWGRVQTPIITVADLIERTEAEMLCLPGLGRTSVNEIKRVLAEHGLALKQLDVG